MTSKKLHPGLVLDIAYGYWRSRALCTACELGVFTELGKRPLTAAQLSMRLQAPLRSLTILLNANVAMGFLTKRDAHYANAPVAEAFLVKGREGYLGDAVLHMVRALSGRWDRLTEVVKRARPVHKLGRAAASRAETVREFTLAMHGMATLVGRQLAERLDLRPYRRLLDIGGGSGAIAVKLAERFPRLRATVLDLPEVCKVARELTRPSPAAGRISFRPQSYFEKLPEGYDVALFSQVLHSSDEATCRRLLERVHEALERPGLIVVVEFALNEEKTRPEFPALFALNMLINTASGAAYSRKELLDWLRGAGFTGARAEKLTKYATLFTAKKA